MFAYTGGLKGDTGDTGIQGDDGDDGAQGIQGIQGIQGVPGSAFTSHFHVQRNSAQSIAVASYVKINFNIEKYDDNNEFDNASNYEFKCKIAGKYHFGANVGMDSLIDTESIFCYIKLNDTTYIAVDQKKQGDAGVGNCTPTVDIELAVDDTIHVEFYHNKGANKDTHINWACCFYGHRVA